MKKNSFSSDCFHPIQSLWIGDSLSTIEQLCISSFLNNGHEFHLYTYKHVKGVPEGATIKDANLIIPEDQVFKDSKGSLGAFSDLFRWTLLSKIDGGYWVDTDVICTKPFDFEDDVVFGMQNFDLAAVGVLKVPSDHVIVKKMLDVCENPHKIYEWDNKKNKRRKLEAKITSKLFRKGQQIRWGAIGPDAFTNIVNHLGLIGLGKSYVHFYPVSSRNWDSIFDETFSKDDPCLFEDTYAIHLWNERLRRDGFDKNGDFSKLSLIEKLKKQYL